MIRDDGAGEALAGPLRMELKTFADVANAEEDSL
jgi:hypothetical protein